MTDLEQRTLPLLELLHAAPGDADAWQRFLVALREAISDQVVVLFAAQRRGKAPGILAGSELELRHASLDEVLRPNVPDPALLEEPLGTVHSFAAESPLREAALYKEVLAPQAILPGPGYILALERSGRYVGSAVLVLPRSDEWKPDPQAEALLARLGPHMVIARTIDVRLADQSGHADALVSAFDRLALGVLFLDDRARVAYTNRSAAEMLGLDPGFTDPAALAADEPDAGTRAWRAVLRSVESDGEHAFVYAHPEDGRPLQVLATPLSWPRDNPTARAQFTRAVFIGDPRTRTGDPTRLLGDLFGLTPGEARLALLLISGCSVEEAARRLAVKKATARGVLRSVFIKTGTNRQADLVRLLLLGPLGRVREE
jgi:DNA-binding CsgD family transcriptional regulator